MHSPSPPPMANPNPPPPAIDPPAPPPANNDNHGGNNGGNNNAGGNNNDVHMADAANNAGNVPLSPPPRCDDIVMSPEAAAAEGMSISAFVTAVVSRLTSLLVLVGWAITSPRTLAWLHTKIKPLKLVDRLHADVAKLTPAVIPSWAWLTEWMLLNLAASTEQPYFVAVGVTLTLLTTHFSTLEALITAVADVRRQLGISPDRYWINVILHKLPPQMCNMMMFRVEGNHSVEWLNWDDFLGSLRINANMYKPWSSSSSSPSGNNVAGGSGSGSGAGPLGSNGNGRNGKPTMPKKSGSSPKKAQPKPGGSGAKNQSSSAPMGHIRQRQAQPHVPPLRRAWASAQPVRSAQGLL
ncbi:hypothetical protein PLESTF_000980900 [Pleodorina starrii]|nr:hypothetical protein PLESTM_000605900 [Pleodorina starrii]GLC70459.1 hypothetical protein PLESTF_000980900 [Pleodorina starrii]